MPRGLVINADDLGLTVGVNNGIFDAYDGGVLTSTSLFANAPATTHAVGHARLRPFLGVGCHLSLVDGTPTLPRTQVATLIQDDGRFYPSWKPFLVACLRGKVSLQEVERELTAQVDRLRSLGVRLTHLDAHQHIHLFPPIFAIVARLAVRFGIPVVRVPFERWSHLRAAGRDRRVARRQRLMNAAMLPWAWRDYRTAAAYGLRVPHFVGRAYTGLLTTQAITATLQSLRSGVTELMVHPGYVDDALSGMNTRLLASRVDEVRLLSTPAVSELLISEQIDLIRHDLAPSPKRNLRHAS